MKPSPLLLMIGLAACQPSVTTTPHPASASLAGEVKAVEQVLYDWYTAMERHDTAGTAAPLTASFFIFEDTTKLRRDDLLAGLNAGFNAGVQTAKLSNLETTVRGDVAWSSFRNEEVFRPTAGEPIYLNFVETVVFVKEDGRWKIDRYHATRINRPNP